MIIRRSGPCSSRGSYPDRILQVSHLHALTAPCAKCILGNGEDVFLGPKISFATASAARQSGKGLIESSQKPDDFKHRHSREERGKEGRERTVERRDRYGDQNNQRDGDQRRRGPRGGGEGEEGQTAAKDRSYYTEREGDEEKDGLAKRNGGRNKFDQPWFRDGDAKEGDAGKETSEHRGWRERERERERDQERKEDKDGPTGGKSEYQPKWMTEGQAEDSTGRTQEDFQKWKQKMKAGPSGPEQTPVEEKVAGIVVPIFETQPEKHLSTNDSTDQIFGFGADTPIEPISAELPSFFTSAERKESGAGIRAAPGTKSKGSRFAGFFSPPPVQEADQKIQAPVPEPEPSAPPGIPRGNTAEDQEGFARVMQMLRTTVNPTQSPSAQAPPANFFGLGFAPGPTASSGPLPGLRAELPTLHGARHQMMAGPTEVRKIASDGYGAEGLPIQASKLTEQRNPERRTEPPMHDMTSPAPILQFQGRPPSQHLSNPPPMPRPELQSRDSEFMRKLLQQPRAPINDVAGYGPGSGRRDPNDITALLNSFANKQPAQPPKPRTQPPPAPPPGFFNERAFAGNHGMEHVLSELPMQRIDRGLPSHDERMSGPPQAQRLNAPDDFPRHLQQPPMGDQMHQRHPQYDHIPPPPWQQQAVRPTSDQHRHDSVPPPPGFSAARAPVLPGFFPFAAGPPPSTHGVQRLPPGFPHNTTPGFQQGPPTNQQQHGLLAGQRRLPTGLPPGQPQGYDVYADPRRGGMPQPMQIQVQNGGGYSQFLKQQQQQQQQGAPY